ncbi:MAG: signal recognition particle-docking protein FtsY [Candidatus Woesearchaeota archaeon]|nr:signal recognition particle-docking protein FtsY [Candidatus Woesearchaeota archaeon]
MFKFLKEKLQKAVSIFSKKAEEEIEEKEEIKEKPAEEEIKTEEKRIEKEEKQAEKKEIKEELKVKEKAAEDEDMTDLEKPKSFFQKIKETFAKKKETKEEPETKPEEKEEIKEKPAEKEIKKIEPTEEEKEHEEIKEEAKAEEKEIEEEPEKKGFFKKISEAITKKAISEERFDELFWDLEVVLLENNVAVEVIEKIKNDMKKEVVEKKIDRFKIEDVIKRTLKNSIEDLFKVENIDLIKKIKEKKEKPYVMIFFGVNGAGKTTNLAKVINFFKKNGLSCIVAASDTFRVAAIEQLEKHCEALDVRMIKHGYGADAAAVAFDAIQHARANKKDVVLIDTAGRQHSNENLMDEMKKIVRVTKPDLKIFVGDSLTGNDAVEQAKQFNESIGIDGIILTKADVDEKGGAAISTSYITKKPILFIGVGQKYDDLKVFEPEMVVRGLGLET